MAAAVVATAWGSPRAGPEPPDPAVAAADSVRAAVTALLRDQEAAWNRGDLDAFMAGYLDSPDLLFTSGGTIQRGHREVRDRYRAAYGAGAEMGTLAFSDLEVHALGRSAAWALGRWRLQREGGEVRGVFTLVLERREEGWRIVHDHTSVEPSGAVPATTDPEGAR